MFAACFFFLQIRYANNTNFLTQNTQCSTLFGLVLVCCVAVCFLLLFYYVCRKVISSVWVCRFALHTDGQYGPLLFRLIYSAYGLLFVRCDGGYLNLRDMGVLVLFYFLPWCDTHNKHGEHKIHMRHRAYVHSMQEQQKIINRRRMNTNKIARNLLCYICE